MTNEELDRARAKEAQRLFLDGSDESFPILIAARLAREGWTPPAPVDPDIAEAEAIWFEGKSSFDLVLEGIKRGRAFAAAEAKPGMVWVKHDGSGDSPIYGDAFVWIKGKRNSQVWTDGEVWVEKAKYIFWANITHYAVITPPEDAA